MPILERLAPLLVCLCAPTAVPYAQDLCQGNGVGGAYLEIGPAAIGGTVEHDLGSPNVPLGLCYLLFSDGATLTPTALLGTICLDVGAPAFGLLALPTDAAGNAHLSVGLPNEPALAGLPPFFSLAITWEGAAWSVSKTVALYLQVAGAWAPSEDLLTRRHSHTATALYADGRDNETRVLVVGGSEFGTPAAPEADSTTELYSPLSRAFSAGPDMVVERTWHTATRLADGRVLIVGGMDSTGACHRSCELFDPVTETLVSTGDLQSPRASHTATLLSDGRVLVAGGYADYSDAESDYAAALATAQASVELYDPSTGLWTLSAQGMAEPRAAHTATRLLDGTVLLTGGIADGFSSLFSPDPVPVYAVTSERFDPATGTLLPEALLPEGRSDHGASLLADGRVLITGGFQLSGSAGWAPVASALAWDGIQWSAVGDLPEPTVRHAQVALENGGALIVGGTSTGWLSASVGSSRVGVHDGAAYTPLADLAQNPALPGAAAHPRCAATLTRAYDGTYLVFGGYGEGSPTLPPANGYLGFVYTPAP